MRRKIWILGMIFSAFLLLACGCGKKSISPKSEEDQVSSQNLTDRNEMDPGSNVVNELRGTFIKSSESDSQENAADTVYLTMATSGNWNGLLRGELMEKYADKLYEWSGGTMVLKIYYNGMLGNDQELLQGVKNGTLSIINSVPSYQVNAVPEAALLDVPGLFDSLDEYNTFINDYYMDTLQEYYSKAGIKLLSSHAFTYRILTSSREVQNLRDLKGLKLRTMENEYQVAMWQSMGALVSPMYFNQMRVAMQQGLLEAQENPLGYMFSMDLQDVQSYVTLTKHIPMISNYLMNEEQFNALTSEQQELLLRMFSEMETELTAGEVEEEEWMRRRLEADGITFIEPDFDLIDAIRESGLVILDMLREDLTDSVVDDYLNHLKVWRQTSGN